MNPLFAASYVVLALTGAACPTEGAMEGPGIAPARDGNIAIRQELDAARKAGTLDAYDLFIARHPRHPLAETARVERARLASERRR